MGIILGLTGFAMSGKDEVADELVRNYGFTKIGMSDTLHECLMVLNPIAAFDYVSVEAIRYRDYCEEVGYVEAKKNPEVRALLQRLGTEVGRNMIDEDIWVNAMLNKARRHLAVVVTGIRYPNEANACLFTWNVVRPGYGPVNDHSSEALAAEINASGNHLTIVNDGTLEQLYESVREAHAATFGGTKIHNIFD